MMNRLYNNIFVCNLDDSHNKKYFNYQLYPINNTIKNADTLKTSGKNTKYDDKVYKRELYQQYKFPEIKQPTISNVYNANIGIETDLQHYDIINKCDKRKYVPNTNSTMYNLHVPYKKTTLPHSLLYESPHLSNSDKPIIEDVYSFNNHTREQRNLFIR